MGRGRVGISLTGSPKAMPNPRSDYLLGVDVGTSTIKVAAFAVDGTLLQLVRADTPTTHLGGGRVEHDPDALWGTTAALIRELTTSMPARQAISVAVASVGEAGLPVDRQGQALRPAIAWFDDRTAVQGRWWTRTVGLDDVHRITGQSIDPHYGVNKLMWVRDNEPGVYARTAQWLSLADFVVHRLAGVFVTDRSLASRTMAYDQAADTWSAILLAEAGLPRSMFPSVVQAGMPIGAITRQGARATGLRVGTPLVAGGHDRLCGAFAARGGGGSAIDSVGSAEALVVPIARYDARGAEEAGYVACYADVVPGGYVYSARVGYAGTLLDWYLALLRDDRTGSEVTYETLADRIPQPLSFSGLLVFPSFGRVVTPFWDPVAAPGLIAGLTIATDWGRLAQALLEGICYSLRASVELVEGLTGEPVDRLRIEGGPTRNDVWMQLKADVLGREVEVVRLDESTALGVALLGGVGVGVYPSHLAAAGTIAASVTNLQPDLRRATVYRTVFKDAYMAVPGALSGVNRVLLEARERATNG